MLGNATIHRDLWATVVGDDRSSRSSSSSSAGRSRSTCGSLTRVSRASSPRLSVVPLFIPVVIASYAMLVFYASDGFMRSLAYHAGWHGFPTLGYTLWCVVLAEIWVNVPFGVLMMSSGLNCGAEQPDRGGARLRREHAAGRALDPPAHERDSDRDRRDIHRDLRAREFHRAVSHRPDRAEPARSVDEQLLLGVQPAAAGGGARDRGLRARARDRCCLRLGECAHRQALRESAQRPTSSASSSRGVGRRVLWFVFVAVAARVHGRPDRVARPACLFGPLALPAAASERVDAQRGGARCSTIRTSAIR